MLLGSLRYYPKAQIRQGLAPRPATGTRRAGNVPSAPSWLAGADDQLTNTALAAWFGARRCTRDKESPGVCRGFRA
jgi:hypothetical protein